MPVQGVSNGARGSYDDEVAWNTPSEGEYSKCCSHYHRGGLVKALSNMYVPIMDPKVPRAEA